MTTHVISSSWRKGTLPAPSTLPEAREVQVRSAQPVPLPGSPSQGAPRTPQHGWRAGLSCSRPVLPLHTGKLQNTSRGEQRQAGTGTFSNSWNRAGWDERWRGSLTPLTRHAQLCCQALPEDVGAGDTLLHGDVPHWHKGADIQGPHPRVLTWWWGRYRNGRWREQADKEREQPFPALLQTGHHCCEEIIESQNNPSWKRPTRILESSLAQESPNNLTVCLRALQTLLKLSGLGPDHSPCSSGVQHGGSPCASPASPRLTRVPAHVNELPGHPGRTQRPFHHSLRGPHEGVDGAVGGGSGINVQQHTSRCPGDGLGHRVNHLQAEGGSTGVTWLGLHNSRGFSREGTSQLSPVPLAMGLRMEL